MLIMTWYEIFALHIKNQYDLYQFLLYYYALSSFISNKMCDPISCLKWTYLLKSGHTLLCYVWVNTQAVPLQ